MSGAAAVAALGAVGVVWGLLRAKMRRRQAARRAARLRDSRSLLVRAHVSPHTAAHFRQCDERALFAAAEWYKDQVGARVGQYLYLLACGRGARPFGALAASWPAPIYACAIDLHSCEIILAAPCAALEAFLGADTAQPAEHDAPDDLAVFWFSPAPRFLYTARGW